MKNEARETRGSTKTLIVEWKDDRTNKEGGTPPRRTERRCKNDLRISETRDKKGEVSANLKTEGRTSKGNQYIQGINENLQRVVTSRRIGEPHKMQR
jgi:hypothetical protein